MTHDTEVETLRQRRQQLADRLDVPVILWSGRSSARNFPANCFPFRASSHFLYFAGIPLEMAAIRLEGGKMTLFVDDLKPENALWHGEMPSRTDIATQIGADAALPMSELESHAVGAATIAAQNTMTALQQSRILNRPVSPAKVLQGIDLDLAQAIVALRLSHDRAALSQLRQAADVTIQAHIAGMAVTTNASWEADVRATMEHVILANNMSCAYTSIVTVHGEVLHN
ncbi:MAG: aminopeptidase P family protein, partial [Chroococcidiopsis sp.]